MYKLILAALILLACSVPTNAQHSRGGGHNITPRFNGSYPSYYSGRGIVPGRGYNPRTGQSYLRYGASSFSYSPGYFPSYGYDPFYYQFGYRDVYQYNYSQNNYYGR